MAVSTNPPAVSRPDRPDWLGILFLAAAGLALRLILWNTEAGLSVEGALSLLSAKAMGSGMAWGHPHPIGYALLIRIFGAMGGSEFGVARALDLLGGLASIVLVWFVARRFLESRWLAFLPVLAMAFLPLTVRYSLGTQPEMVYTALILGAVVSLLHKRLFLAGALLGLSVQIRPEALLVLGGLCFAVRGKRDLGFFFLAALSTFALIWVLQGLLLLDWSPFPQVVRNITTHWMDREPGGGGEAPGGWVGRGIALAVDALRYGGFWVPLLAMGALLASGPILAAGLLPALVSPWINVGGHPRFVVPLLPFLWILAALWVARAPAPRRLWYAVICIVGFALSAAVNIPAYTFQEDGKYPELQRAGLWLKDYVRPDNVVTGELPYAAYYSGARYRPLPRGYSDYDEAVDAIVDSGADFVVFHQQALHREMPVLAPLVEEKAIVWHEIRLEPVYFSDTYVDGRTLIYRVVRPGGPAPLPTEGPSMRRLISVIKHGKDHNFHARVAMRAKKWDTAAGEYQMAANRHPNTPEAAYALNNRAWCLLQAGQFDRAKSEANRAIKLLPNNPDLIDTMIEIVKAMGQDRAVEYWQKKLEEAKAASDSTGAAQP